MEVRIISAGSEATPSKRWPWLLLGIIVVLVIALLVAVFNRSGHATGNPSDSPSGTSTPSTTGTTVASPSSSVSSETSEPESSPPVDVAVVGEVVPGLWRGTAVVGKGGTDEIYGGPVGWPQTVEGAVAAAMHYMAYNLSLAAFIDEQANQVQQRIFTADGLLITAGTDEDRAKGRDYFRLTPTGEVLTSAGGVFAD